MNPILLKKCKCDPQKDEAKQNTNKRQRYNKERQKGIFLAEMKLVTEYSLEELKYINIHLLILRRQVGSRYNRS